MALTVIRNEYQKIAAGQNGRYVHIGAFTWTSTNTTAALATSLKVILDPPTFLNVDTAAQADTTSVLATPTADGKIIVSGGTLSLSRTVGVSGLTVMFKLSGY